jgi:signal transduction histidine kinase
MFLLLGTAVVVVIVLLAGSNGATSEAVQAVPSRPGSSASIHAAVTQHSADTARLLAVSWLTLALTAVASAFLGWFAAGRVLRPLREMTATARTISAGNLHQRLALTGPSDEFMRLGDTVDDLLERLETSFAAQRRFVANAAHELRTPLTLERTLLQVALADPKASVASLRATCEELLAAGRSQERLLESLLTLATSERGLERRQAIDLMDLVRQLLDRATPELRAHRVELHAELGPATVLGDPTLVERLLANLIDNSLRYNVEDGFVVVRTGSEAAGTILSVSNSGKPIGLGEADRLFEPFRRLNGDRTSSGDGYGLGLSIVRAIATAHGAAVTALPRDGGGLVVTVSFPAVAPVRGSV